VGFRLRARSRGFAGDERDGGHSFAVLAKYAVYQEDSPAGVAIHEQVPGESQRPRPGQEPVALRGIIGAMRRRQGLPRAKFVVGHALFAFDVFL
jgi:hypothetical protein